MKRRRLGNTDMDLPIVSFGGSPLGHAFGYVGIQEGLAAVRAALDCGFNHFDTSPFYGSGISETVLGIALRDIPRDQFTISTKIGRYGEDVFDFRPERVAESIEASLFRLDVDYLDIVFLHDVEFTDYQRSINQALPALLKEKNKGKIRYVGIAGYPFKPLLFALKNHQIDVTLNYNHYTLQNRRLVTEMVDLLKACGIGIINAAPFAQRLLVDMELPYWHPADVETRDVCRQLLTYCKERGVDPAKLCVQFSTRQEDLATCVIGGSSPKKVRQWATWLEQPYEEEAIREVEKILTPIMDRNFNYGRVENNDPISSRVELFNP